VTTYIMVYFASALLALLATPVVIRIGQRMGIVDAPNVRKVHAAVTPRIGGVAIVFAMLTTTGLILALDNGVGEAVRGIRTQLVGLIVASILIFVSGLIDDVRNLPARAKLAFQIGAALLVCAFGVRIEEIDISQDMVVHFGLLSWPITVFWIVGITNAVNLIDGLDGLAAGISAIACGVIAVFAFHTGQVVMGILMIALLGSLTGFLFFNFNPAKVFMGDCGSLFLGFVLATTSVMCVSKTAMVVGLALPMLALGIPIFDTLFSMLRRILERRSCFAPDRGHIHHRLLDMGLDHRHAVILMYAVTVIAAGLGVAMMVIRDEGMIVVFAAVVLFMALIFRVVGAVDFRESFLILRKNLAISRDAKEEKRSFEHVQLRIRQARTFDEWWKAACAAAAEMDFVWLALNVVNRDGKLRTLVWRTGEREFAVHETVNMSVPVRHRRQGPPLQIEVAVRINGSLESAGRRAALFVRLIDQHNLAVLPHEAVRATVQARPPVPVSVN